MASFFLSEQETGSFFTERRIIDLAAGGAKKEGSSLYLSWSTFEGGMSGGNRSPAELAAGWGRTNGEDTYVLFP